MNARVQVPVGLTAGGGRSFSVAYRLEFLRLWDEANSIYGAKNRLLREHGLARPTVNRWLDARERGEFEESMVKAAKKSRNHMLSEERAEVMRLRKRVAELEKKVAEGEAVQQILGKAYELLEGITTSSTTEDPEIPAALMSAEEYAKWLQRNKLS